MILYVSFRKQKNIFWKFRLEKKCTEFLQHVYLFVFPGPENGPIVGIGL